jgi:serine/threonine phosphatase stp
MISYFLTDTGRIRTHNEDSVTIVKNKKGEMLACVADGVGGHKAGEIASQIAINTITEAFKETFKDLDKLSAINWLRQATTEVNNKIFSYVDKHEEAKGMGTTLVCALITKDYILIGNVGDSSGFAVKKEKLYKITYDHTLVNLLLKAGEITEEEAKNHPKKNVLMKALGTNNPIEIDIFDCDLDVDGILLASDGLTNMLDKEKIMTVLNSNEPIQDKVIKLIAKANNRGGTDNISVAYVDFKEGVKK